jgi:hypothetical protein
LPRKASAVYRRPVRRAVLLVVAAACAGEPLELPPPQTARNPGAPPTAPQTAPIQGQPPARAFVVERTSDLLTGPKAAGRPGDYKLDNGVAAFVINQAPLGFAASGGHLVDAAIAGGRDALDQLLLLDGEFPRQPIYERVEPLSRGNVAVVRASGHDAEEPSLRVVTEYALAPGATALEVTTVWTNDGARPLALAAADALQLGHTDRFVPGRGFLYDEGRRPIVTPEGWMLAVGEAATYGYVVSGPLRARHGWAWSDIALVDTTLAPGASARTVRWLLVAAAPTLALGEAIAALRGESWARLGGRVVEEGSDAPVDGVRLVLSDQNGRAMALAQSGPNGWAQVAPPGEYVIGAESPGRSGPERLEVTLHAGTPTTLDVLMSRPGALAWSVVEGGRPSPAKLTLVGVAPTRTPRLGPPWTAPGGNIAFTVSGHETLELPPGRYRAIASRGPAFTIDEKEVVIAPGETARAAFELKRAVELPGLVCADLHQHASPSPDSAVSPGDRAAADLAEGLDAAVASNHDFVGDFAVPANAARPILVIAGEEATRDGVGHFNAWPLTVHPGEPRGGAVETRGKGAHEIVAALRAADGGADRVIVVNHPRASFGAGYFELVGFDPSSSVLPRDWEGGFDAIEIWNGKDPTRAEAPLADWFSLANRGLVYTGVGGSDTHLVYGQEAGYPRTCFFLDDPAHPTAEALTAAVKRRREALVTNGPFVTLSASGKTMGQLAPAPRGRAHLEVEVRAAPWVDTRKLEVFVNGGRRGKPIDIPPGRAPLRYKGAIDLRIDRDASVVVIVRGEASLEPVVSRPEGTAVPTPMAITNPIFLDRDGDGKFTAPLAAPPPAKPTPPRAVPKR